MYGNLTFLEKDYYPIPESKLGLRGNHEGVKLLHLLGPLVRHPWARRSLLHNLITSRK